MDPERVMQGPPQKIPTPQRSALSRLLKGKAPGGPREEVPAATPAGATATVPPSPYPLDHGAGAAGDPFAALNGQRVFFDGVFKGDYSLAIVNRQLARALARAGIDLVLHSGEDGLHDDPHLAAMPDVAALMATRPPQPGTVDIHLRNTWPPRAEDMIGRLNAYVCFAWEENTAPAAMMKHFNAHLDLMMVTATFVEDAFRRSGLKVPIAVVGNGVDHLDASADASAAVPPAGAPRRLLHVSSCFPRKGADVLVKAFAAHFTPADDVELVIKTFDNRHNTIDADVAAARAAHPGAAPITVIKDSLPEAALRDLIAGSALLAAPSRGEGFGLPLAEATMLGVPVVTTGYSGQTDFCTERTAWLVDYALVPSAAHVSAGSEAVWAEPDPVALAWAMRAALDQPAEARRRVLAGQALLGRHFTWDRVAARVGHALSGLPVRSAARPCVPVPIDLVSSWNQTCGIATYAAHLFETDALKTRLAHVHARLLDGDAAEIALRTDTPVTRSWGYSGAAIERLARDLRVAPGHLAWVQHHPGHFSDADMDRLARALGDSHHAARVVTLHNARETLEQPARWLDAFDAVIVHTDADRALLEARTSSAVAVIPHGILAAQATDRPDPAHFTVGTFGFLYPHKNVPLLVEAAARALPHLPDLRLRLMTCARADAVSLKERARVEATIAALGLAGRVEADFGFLDEATVRHRLAGCDLICFPYGASTESATGAARVALSLDRPILCSDSAVMRDIRPYALGLPRLDSATLAEALITLGASPAIRELRARERRAALRQHHYDRVGHQHARLIDRLTGGAAHAA